MGFLALDADEGISRHVNIRTGRAAPPPRLMSLQFMADHEFRFNLDLVREIDHQPNEMVFLLGSAYGEGEVAAIADRSFYLHVEERELARRIETRTSNRYGQLIQERELILEWHRCSEPHYQGLGMERLDGSPHVSRVAKNLLDMLSKTR